ncbi:MAG: phage major capsid protein [Mycolicibacterium neoaurum]|uniref:phage major capsid family protein n=1 Tax=Mycolicibacterium neoaurum TaxID=1795 RepID=UPI002FF760A4
MIGDWNFAKLWVREDMRLDTDFGGELFTKNQFVLRAEMRVGCGPLRPTAFRAVDLTA